MTSSSDPTRREDIALLHHAAEVLRAKFRRLRAEDDLHSRPWGATADIALLGRAKELDEDGWALGRGELSESDRATAVEEACGIVKEAGG